MGKFTISRLVGGVFVLLGLTFVVPGIASAAAPATARARPVVAVTPSRIGADGQAVSVSGSGLPSGRTGLITVCSSAFPQPTVAVDGVPTPVSCSRPRRVHIGVDGTLSDRFHVVDGKVGPPASGIDSSGRPAGTDARRYPCPPSPGQRSAGAYCYLELRWGTGAGDQTVQPLTFAVTRVSPSAPPSHSPPSTVAEATHAAATPVVVVKPRTDLTSGRGVVVIASGLPPNGTGEIMECNGTTPQPTVPVAGVPTPVSCTDPSVSRWTFTAGGRLRALFRIVTGVVGPPGQGTDSSGRPAATDAKRFPCPPREAQAAAGVHCYLVLRWGAGAHDRAVRTITFAAVEPQDDHHHDDDHHQAGDGGQGDPDCLPDAEAGGEPAVHRGFRRTDGADRHPPGDRGGGPAPPR